MSQAAAGTMNDSFDEATAQLIQQAHRCSTLPVIEDHLPYRNIGEMWHDLATVRGDRHWMSYYSCSADVEEPDTYTFAQFGDLIDRVARLLTSKYGIRPGGSVATLTINQPLTVAIYFACWRLGARVVPINPSESDDRVAYILANSEATLFVVHAGTREDIALLEKHIGNAALQQSMVLDGSRRPLNGWDDFQAALNDLKSAGEPPAPPRVSGGARALAGFH